MQSNTHRAGTTSLDTLTIATTLSAAGAIAGGSGRTPPVPVIVQ